MATFYVDVTDGLSHQAFPAESGRHRFWIYIDGFLLVRETAIGDVSQGVFLTPNYPPQEFRSREAVHIRSTGASGASGGAQYVRFLVEYF